MSMTDHGAALPELPKPALTAYVEGPAMQGGEYRNLADSYEPGCAMFSPEQMKAYALAAIEAETERCKAISQDAAIRYSNGYIVNWDEEFAMSPPSTRGHDVSQDQRNVNMSGWKLVPIKATDEMVRLALLDSPVSPNGARAIWRDMIEGSPQPGEKG